MSRTDKDAPVWVRDLYCHYDASEPSRFPCGGDTRRHRRLAFYYVPERQAVRRAVRYAVRDYNRHGETDVVVPIGPHRHSPWNGGWWD